MKALLQFLKDLLTFDKEIQLPKSAYTKRLEAFTKDSAKTTEVVYEAGKPAPKNFEMVLVRKYLTDKSTIGELYVDGKKKRECWTLEDKVRKGKKVYGETAIPKGLYNISITHSPRFKTQLPLLHNVKGFTGVRIHPGNTHKDTEGCILLGQTRSKDFIGRSRLAFNALFKKLQQAHKEGREITLRIM